MQNDGVLPCGCPKLENEIRRDMGSEMRRYLTNILNQISSTNILDLSFKTRIPGINKEVFGNVHLFDMEVLGILDLMVICW